MICLNQNICTNDYTIFFIFFFSSKIVVRFMIHDLPWNIQIEQMNQYPLQRIRRILLNNFAVFIFVAISMRIYVRTVRQYIK